MSTMVPTFSILFRHVTGELITSLGRHEQRSQDNTFPPLRTGQKPFLHRRRNHQRETVTLKSTIPSSLGALSKKSYPRAFRRLSNQRPSQALTWPSTSGRCQELPSAGRERSGAWCGYHRGPGAEGRNSSSRLLYMNSTHQSNAAVSAAYQPTSATGCSSASC